MLKTTIIFDNHVENPNLKPEFGFSCIIQTPDKCILFDTGSNGEILLSNMQILGYSPKDIDLVVLSHYHWDHVDGFNTFLKANNNIEAYVTDSFPEAFKQNAVSMGATMVDVSGLMKISDSVFTSGVFEGYYKGIQMDEQALICETSAGAVVITGCAHPGIMNIVDFTRRKFGKIIMVMGGFHLRNESQSELEKIVRRFKEMEITQVCPVHCTGDKAREIFKMDFGGDCISGGAGTTLEFDHLS